MEAISKKGVKYINDFPKKRILNVLLNFDIAVLLFIVTNILLGRYYSYDEYLLSLIGWTSVGNSNWYIFVILLCYVHVYIAFRVSVFKTIFQKWIAFTFLSLMSIITLIFFKYILIGIPDTSIIAIVSNVTATKLNTFCVKSKHNLLPPQNKLHYVMKLCFLTVYSV